MFKFLGVLLGAFGVHDEPMGFGCDAVMAFEVASSGPHGARVPDVISSVTYLLGTQRWPSQHSTV